MVHELSSFHLHFIERFPGLVGRGMLVALSGGADSVALLHLLLHEELRLEIRAAHVHHGIRGPEADEDARFCGELCRELSVPFHLLRLESGLPTPLGKEGSWRAHRYASLNTLASEYAIPAIATGHHRDDISEGVVMQILRGTGPRALAGIAAQTPEMVIRPLLPWRRSEIREWLRSRRIDWREDSSNQDVSHLRNRIRHQVLPVLEETEPAVREHLASLAEALAADEQALQDELTKRARWIDPWHPFGSVPRSAIAEFPKALRIRWLQAQVHRLAIGAATRRQIELFGELLDRGRPRTITLAKRWRIREWRRKLWIEPPEIPARPFLATLEPGSEAPLPAPEWIARIGARDGPSDPETEWSWTPHRVGKLTVADPLSSAASCSNDQSKWLRGLLSETLPRHLRSAWPVFSVDGTIGWVPGVWQHPESGTNNSILLEVVRRCPA